MSAFVLAVAAFVLGLVPFLGFITWIMAVVAVVLGAIALNRRVQGRGFAATGVILGLVAIVTGFAISGATLGKVSQTTPQVHAAATDPPATTAAAPAAAPTSKAAVPAPKATPKPMPRPVAVLKTYSGSGDDVVHVNYSNPVILSFICSSCSGNTVLQTDSGMDTLLVNTIGSYHGRHIVNTSDGSLLTKLTITADAHWTLKVENPSVAITTRLASIGDTISGHGDDVVAVGSAIGDAKVINRGDSNFVLQAYGGSDSLVINEIGSYSGTVPLQGPEIVQVESNGDWSITGEQ
jgi:hypothetical protein